MVSTNPSSPNLASFIPSWQRRCASFPGISQLPKIAASQPCGQRCDRSWLLVHTAPAPGSTGRGGIFVVVQPRVFVRKNKTRIRRRETNSSRACRCQDAAVPAHNAHGSWGSHGSPRFSSLAAPRGQGTRSGSHHSELIPSCRPGVASTEQVCSVSLFSFLKLRWKSRLLQSVLDGLRSTRGSAWSSLCASSGLLTGGPSVPNALLGLGEEKNPQTASPREEEVEKELKISISSRKGEVTYPESRAGGNGGQAWLGCTFSVKKTSFSQKLAV